MNSHANDDGSSLGYKGDGGTGVTEFVAETFPGGLSERFWAV